MKIKAKDKSRTRRRDRTSCWALSVTLLTGSTLGCMSEPSEATAAHSTAALSGAENTAVMGFEDPSLWTTTTGTLTRSTNASQGKFSVALRPNNFTTLKSAKLSSLGAPIKGIAFDLWMPTTQPNPFWLGLAQLYVDIPSKNIHNAFVGQTELTGQPLGQWTTQEIAVPAQLAAQLAGLSYTDLTFSISLNVPGAPGEYLIDNLRTRAEVTPWPSPPVSATPVSDATLQGLRAAGNVVEVVPEDRARQRAAAAVRATEDAATLSQIIAVRPELGPRLAATPGPGATVLPDGNVRIQIANDSGDTQNITLDGPAVRAHTIASAYRRFNTLDNQRAIYKTLYPNLPAACAGGMPSPQSIASLTTADLKALNRKIGHCWRGASASFGRRNVKLPAGFDLDPRKYEGAPSTITKATGDGSGACPSTHVVGGVFDGASWPGKGFDTSVKNQGARGSCVAFGIVAAMENNIARSTNQRVNLAEQSLYARAKLFWEPDNLQDGLSSVEDTLDYMMSTQYGVPFERIWPYNPSFPRLPCDASGCNGKVNDPVYYINSCSFFDVKKQQNDDYTGPACSETVHQANLITARGKTFFSTPEDRGAFGISSTVELADIEDTESADEAIAMLNSGASIVMAFDVMKSFGTLPKGIFQGSAPDDVYVGAHAIEVSGVVLNSQLAPGTPQGKGGGWLILKNSWGCWGDIGWGYMSLDAADSLLNSAVALLPTKPLLNLRPTLTVTSPANGAHFALGNANPPIQFRATTFDEQDGADAAAIVWTLDGQAFGKGQSFDSYLGVGQHTIQAVATDSQGMTTTAKIDVTIDNDAPTAQITEPISGQTLLRGVNTVVSGTGGDVNDLIVPCGKLTWTSSVPSDPINGQSGCDLLTSFPTTGSRTLSLTARDSVGATGATQVTVNVVEPSTSSAPAVQIVSPGVGTVIVEDRDLPLALSGLVKDFAGLPPCPAATSCYNTRWAVKGPITSPVVLGTDVTDLTWIPSSLFPLNCGPTTVVLQFCATDVNGSDCQTMSLVLKGPTC